MQTDADYYRKKYIDLTEDKTKLWMTLEELEEQSQLQVEKEVDLTITEKPTRLPMKRKKKLLSRTHAAPEAKELENPRYQWGMSPGKHEMQDKASAVNLIKDLPRSLKCLSTFVSSVNSAEINIVLSPHAVIPELDNDVSLSDTIYINYT